MVYILTTERIIYLSYMIFEVIMKFKGKWARIYKKYLVPMEGAKLIKECIYCCCYIILGREIEVVSQLFWNGVGLN